MVRALVYEQFGGSLDVRAVAAPTPPPGGVVVAVAATGVCRSDWHGWQGHDPDVRLPHVPGHELAGHVLAVGEGVAGWRVGARVTAPFVCGCGTCPTCLGGDPQVCPQQTQPGFTHWGSFAEQVVLHAADANLVALPDDLSDVAAASLGCRYATAFRAVREHGRVADGEHLLVLGCGGVGLAAVQVAVERGARVLAVDPSPGARDLALRLGADLALPDVLPEQVRDLTSGGVHVAVDALGSPATCVLGVSSLRRRGRHVQVGLLPPELGRPELPMERVIGWELEVLGSHGMAAAGYPELLALVAAGRLDPTALVTSTTDLDGAGAALAAVGAAPGIAVIVP